MGKREKLLRRILLGRSDASIDFNDLRKLLLSFGFEERTRGSHHIFRRDDIDERPNLQRDDGKAKRYQVRQIRALIIRYGLGDFEDE